MIIDTYFTPYFNESEILFENSLVVAIDVLRASTTVCAALHNGAKEIIPCEQADKAVSIYSNIAREYRFLGGERGGIKPKGFDAGNSPLEYSEANVKNKTVIMTTTNGTIAFNKAKNARKKVVGAFVNHEEIYNFLKNEIETLGEEKAKVIFICAGTNGRMSYEDTLCAGAFIRYLIKDYPNAEMTDSSLAAKDLFVMHFKNLREFIENCSHAKLLKSLGFSDDIDICLSLNIFPVVPLIDGTSITKNN